MGNVSGEIGGPVDSGTGPSAHPDLGELARDAGANKVEETIASVGVRSVPPAAGKLKGLKLGCRQWIPRPRHSASYTPSYG